MSKKKQPEKRPIGFRLPGKRRPPKRGKGPRGELIVYPPTYAWPVEEEL